MSNTNEYGLATTAIRVGHTRTHEGEHSEALFNTSSFVFANAAEAAAKFQNEVPGNVYSRFTNPTVRTFEQRLASMEGGECCVATSSGMAAIMATCVALLEPGEHVVAASGMFGATTQFFKKYLTRMGNPVDFAQIDNLDDWRRSLRPDTRMLFVETPTNPLTQLADIRALADIAHEHGAILVVDNCFCTPALQQPLALGADIVIHSATKYIDGQGRCVGGAVVGDRQRVGESVFSFLRTAGPTMSPFNAWVFSKGLETLELRMQRHCQSAAQIAQWLTQHPSVDKVYYPGLVSHPQHKLCQQQQSDFGGIVSFEVKGDKQNAWNVIDHTEMLSITANLGDTKTTITHPASTTHGRISETERQQAGISQTLLRVAAGLESTVDIINDLEQGLRQP